MYNRRSYDFDEFYKPNFNDMRLARIDNRRRKMLRINQKIARMRESTVELGDDGGT